MYAFLCIHPDPAKDGVGIELTDIKTVDAFSKL